jgi:hypothetical protein
MNKEKATVNPEEKNYPYPNFYQNPILQNSKCSA